MCGVSNGYGGKRDVYSVFWEGGSLMERDHLGEPAVDVRIILIWFFRMLGRGVME
jgi:hypothetical protein